MDKITTLRNTLLCFTYSEMMEVGAALRSRLIDSTQEELDEVNTYAQVLLDFAENHGS